MTAQAKRNCTTADHLLAALRGVSQIVRSDPQLNVFHPTETKDTRFRHRIWEAYCVEARYDAHTLLCIDDHNDESIVT